jgi:adenine-specific DNA-methyltransferase
MEKLRMETKDITQENIERIAELFPNVVTEMRDENGKIKKGINFELLKQELSGDVVDGEECYDFTWVGKRAAIVEANTPIRKTLRPCIEESKNWETTENLYIEGDNLDALKLLQESYLNSIKMIYIDPPYNTGNDSFVYPDDYSMDQDQLDEKIEYRDEDGNIQFRKNTETNPRFHSDWCSMIYSRLRLAKTLLSEDGVIFTSIDDNEVHTLKQICNEVFGERNFVCQFVWKSKLGKVGTTSTISSTHEYILCYAKELTELSFTMIETMNKGRVENLRQWGQADRREDRPSMYYPITIDGVEVYPIRNDGSPGRWRVGKERSMELLANGMLKLVNKGDKFEIHRMFEESLSIVPYDTLLIDEIGTTARGSIMLKDLGMNKMFDYPKPVELIRFFSYLCSGDTDIILDFFAGSSTTAHAVMQLNAEDGGNRKFIMVQLPEPTDEKSEAYKAGYKTISDIGKERIRRAGEKIKAEVEEANAKLKDGEEPKKVPDIGFRVLKVDSTNMKDVYYAANEVSQDMLFDLESNIKEDRSDLDLLYGVLVDWGLPLSLSHEIESFDGVDIHTVDHGSLIACFADDISENVVREIAKRQPLRAVFRDSSFGSSPQRINVEEIFKLLAPRTSVRVI